MYCNVLYCIVLYCIVLYYYIILYDIIWYDMIWYIIWYNIWYIIWYNIWYIIWYNIWYIIWYNIWYIIWYNIRYIILYYIIWYYIILCYIILYYIIFFCSLLFIYCIVYIIVYMMHDIWYDTWYMIEATKIFGISNQQDAGSRLPWCHASGALVVPEDTSEVAAAPGESPLLQLCCTPCQEKALRAILEAVSSKSSGCHLAVHKTSVFAFDFFFFEWFPHKAHTKKNGNEKALRAVVI